MHIAQIQITNYKSFLKSAEIKLSPGFNVVVGQNNAGKTAFIQALSLRSSDSPHRSINTIPYDGAAHSRLSSVSLIFEISKDEFQRFVADNFPEFFVPLSRKLAIKAERVSVEFIKLLQRDISINWTLANFASVLG